SSRGTISPPVRRAMASNNARFGFRERNSSTAGSAVQPAAARPTIFPSGWVTTASTQYAPVSRTTYVASYLPGTVDEGSAASSIPLGSAGAFEDSPDGGSKRTGRMVSLTTAFSSGLNSSSCALTIMWTCVGSSVAWDSTVTPAGTSD